MGLDFIDPAQHPLLREVAQGAHWAGRDDYPAWPEWAAEHERWLRFIDAGGAWAHYVRRLQGLVTERDEALAEIGTAYFLVQRCGLSIIAWQPPGAPGRRGEFSIGLPDGGSDVH